MNQTQAYQYGRAQGRGAIQSCDVAEPDQREVCCDCVVTGAPACKQCLMHAAFESESIGRQYSPFEFFARDCNEDENRADGLWDAYERGVGVAIRQGLKARLSTILARPFVLK